MDMSAADTTIVTDGKSPQADTTLENRKNGAAFKSRRRNKEKQKPKQDPMKTSATINHPDQIDKGEKVIKAKKKKPKKAQNKNNNKPNDSKELSVTTSDNISALDPNEAKRLKKKRKRQQQKEKRKQLQQAQKLRGEKPRLPVNKITVRNLPPNLSKASFINKVFQKNPELEQYVAEYYYVNGFYPKNKFESSVPSRCYINCTDESTMMLVGRAVKAMTFTDDTPSKPKTDNSNNDENLNKAEVMEDLETYIPSVEKSFYQVMPEFKSVGEPVIDKWDFMNGKLNDDFAFKKFCEAIDSEGKVPLPDNIFSKGNKNKKKEKITADSQKNKGKKISKAKIDKLETKQEGVNKKKAKKRNKKKVKAKKDESGKQEITGKIDPEKKTKEVSKKSKKFKKKTNQKPKSESVKNLGVENTAK